MQAITKRLRLGNILQISPYPTEPFPLASGRKSRIYFEGRALALDPGLSKFILGKADEMVQIHFGKKNLNESLGGVANVPHAADHNAGRFADELDLPFLQLKKIDGTFQIPAGCREKIKKLKIVLIHDDVLTSGESAKGVADYLWSEFEVKTKAVFAILNRQLEAKELFRREGIEVYSLLNLAPMLEYLLKFSQIPQNRQNFPDIVLNGNEIEAVEEELACLSKHKNPLTASA